MKEIFLNLIKRYSDSNVYAMECWTEISTKYSSKSRHYHNFEHLKSMFLLLEKVKSKIKNLGTFLFAIYYHDIIYSATKSDNEHQSALYFKKNFTNFF